ncbi:4-hydroxy-tetrahydrodipicolinate synthase [Alkalibaculum sp. M08DMB]|uniref:4-hydroxy-tetrahydrodipicolinate synthase n=1 Tax=Alkalibaculum sporogenes TaxID=2655001 RepID=A0A6A7K5T8_9FIRM|nr:4-hydroxy-tetrahydrodipicolinate synthase [Alkalibaculum sporogenes]MPW24701.1 4-hydroxy-tetrahydrodipicolinate synthase [Alkalibaculum sporogenes]
MSLFQGSGVAIVTPFNKNGIAYEKLKELLNWHVEEGTDAIIICGTTGETPTLSEDEHKKVIKFTVEIINKRIPVIAGTGSNSTAHTISMSKYAQEVGADGLLIMNPYYNKSTQKGIIAHFEAIAQEVSIPIIIYNVPSRTGCNITPETISTLAKVDNIVAVKEASSDIVQIVEVARLCPKDFNIYSGNDNQVVPILSLGAKGVISVSANIIPKDMHNMVYLYLEGKVQESLSLQLKMNSLNNALFIESNPIPIKTAMNLMGMEVGPLRMPLLEMEENHITVLKDEMNAYGIL